MKIDRCHECGEPVLEGSNRKLAIDAGFDGKADMEMYDHEDCEKALKREELFVTDDPPKDIGVEGVYDGGRRYVVTDPPRMHEETGLAGKTYWTVIGVWLDPTEFDD